MLSRKEVDSYQQRLTSLLKRVQGNLGMVRDEAMQKTGGEPSGGLSDVPLHPADLASRQFEEDVSLGLVGNEERLLEEIDAALSRLEQGTFGRCEKCRKEIAKNRLDALPYSRLCVACAREKQQTVS